MSKIIRPDLDVQAFASAAQGTERSIFGDPDFNNQSDDLTANMVAEFFRGWELGVAENGKPPQQYFNSVGYVATALSAYLYQMGTPEWNINQFYPENARAMDATGTIWRSLQDHTGQAQVEGAYWTNDLSFYVGTTGNETIADVKTFSSSPIVPTPTTDFQASTKKYVDDNVETPWVANDERAKTALNATGAASIYATRAWCALNGTGVVSILGSGNILGVTDVGVGRYTVNFLTAMPDNGYAVGGVANNPGTIIVGALAPSLKTTSGFSLITHEANSNAIADFPIVDVTVTR